MNVFLIMTRRASPSQKGSLVKHVRQETSLQVLAIGIDTKHYHNLA